MISGTPTTNDPLGERLAKLVRLLGSDRDGEALGARNGMVRILTGVGSSLHELADWIARFQPAPQQPEFQGIDPEPDPRKPWQAFAAELLRHPEIIGMRGNRFDQKLFDREIDFLNNMRRSKFAPSAGQEKWLGDIESRIRRAA
jgi:hypothetical protein